MCWSYCNCMRGEATWRKVQLELFPFRTLTTPPPSSLCNERHQLSKWRSSNLTIHVPEFDLPGLEHEDEEKLEEQQRQRWRWWRRESSSSCRTTGKHDSWDALNPDIRAEKEREIVATAVVNLKVSGGGKHTPRMTIWPEQPVDWPRLRDEGRRTVNNRSFRVFPARRKIDNIFRLGGGGMNERRRSVVGNNENKVSYEGNWHIPSELSIA